MGNNVQDNSLKTLRTFMFDEMVKIRNGEADVNESNAMAKLASKVIDSYKVEIDAVRAANDLKDKNASYSTALKAINISHE